MGVYRKGGKWHIDYYFQGRRIREVAGLTKEQAQKALSVRQAEIYQGKFKIQDAKPSPRFEEFAKQFLEWSRANKRSWLRDESLVAHLVRFFRGRTLAEISPWLVERYRQARREAVYRGKPLRPATINREVACIKRMYTLAIQWELVTENPAKGVKLWREDNRRERILTQEEINRLLEHCTGHSRPFVLVALNTGMRVGEILTLTWDQIDLSRGVITLTQTKNGKVRKIPMNRLVSEAIKGLPRRGPYVFGGDKPYGSIKTAFRAACKRAKIRGCRFHDLRHTAATYLVLAGVDLPTVSELLGHSDISLTMRYAHPTPEHKCRAVAALERLIAAPRRHQMDTTAHQSIAAIALTARQARDGPVAQVDRAEVS